MVWKLLRIFTLVATFLFDGKSSVHQGTAKLFASMQSRVPLAKLSHQYITFPVYGASNDLTAIPIVLCMCLVVFTL